MTLVTHAWGIDVLVLFKAILGSFSALVLKLPVIVAVLDPQIYPLSAYMVLLTIKCSRSV